MSLSHMSMFKPLFLITLHLWRALTPFLFIVCSELMYWDGPLAPLSTTSNILEDVAEER